MNTKKKIKPYLANKLTGIPKHWNVLKLGQLGSFAKGQGISQSDLVETGCPCVRYGDIYTTHNFVIKEFHSYISHETANQSVRINNGDILFAGSGETLEEIGKAVAYIGTEEAFAGGDVIILTVNTANSVYLSYLLNDDLVLWQKRRFGQGQSIVHIYPKDLAEILVPIPPLAEQKIIAVILCKWDEMIEKTKQLIIAKKKLKNGLMQQLLSEKKRFKQFRGLKWQEPKASELFESYSKKANDGEELLSVTQDRGVIPRRMLDSKVTMPEGNTDGYKLVSPGNFVISLRSFQGGLEYSEYKGLVSPAYTVLKPKQKISNAFYKHYFKSYDFIGHLATAVIGIRDGKQVSYEDFGFVKLMYPPVDEQSEIAKVLDAADKEIEHLQNKAELLKQQKKGLMQKLLTGKIRVKC